MATLPSNTSFAQTFALENNNNNSPHHHLRDVSFSCYLNDAEESLIRKLSESSRSLSGSHRYEEKSKKELDDGEIGVFGAEKYFSGRMDDEDISKISELTVRKSPIVVKNLEPVTVKLQNGSPSIRSESSNSNSQNTLLQNVSRNPLRRKTTPMKNFLASLGCSCLDNDSVQIDKARKDLPVKEYTIPGKIPNLEVFGSPVSDKNRNFERKLSVISWENPPTTESGGTYNDNDSDASSDLFEIDSLSGKANNFLEFQEFPTSYAPSEASIDWSVATASALDEELKPTITRPSLIKSVSINVPKSNTQRQRSSSILLAGCKSEKAIKVSEDNAYRTGERASSDSRMRPLRRVSDSFARIPSQQNRQPPVAATRSLPRSRSQCSSHLLYKIQ